MPYTQNMKTKMPKGAHVVNGNKAYRRRVFVVRGARIVKSWDTDKYLSLTLKEIRSQVPPVPVSSLRFAGFSV